MWRPGPGGAPELKNEAPRDELKTGVAVDFGPSLTENGVGRLRAIPDALCAIRLCFESVPWREHPEKTCIRAFQ